MAHTDACKIQVTQFVKKLTEKGLSVNEACKEAERESDGIPAETIRYWWKQIQKEIAENVGEFSPTPKTPGNLTENQNFQVSEHGGAREGAGRPGKYTKLSEAVDSSKEPESPALDLADIAINQLSKIKDNDPYREAALQKVINWAEKFKVKNLSVKPFHMPIMFARLSIMQLERIEENHHARKEALKVVTQWLKQHP